jgi:hypothetical protein
MLATVNGAGLFRDLFFVIVPAAAIALATTTDYMCAHVISGRMRSGALVEGIVFILILANFMVLLSGFVGFLEIPPASGPLSPDKFKLASWVIYIGLCISLGSEIWVSLLGNRHRMQHAPATV